MTSTQTSKSPSDTSVGSTRDYGSAHLERLATSPETLTLVMTLLTAIWRLWTHVKEARH